MGIKIEDGTGSGRSVAVNFENRILTAAIVTSEHHHINETDGNAWSVSFENIDPTDADDYFFYFKNTSSDSSYIIPKIRLASSVGGQAEFHVVSGIAAGGNDDTPVNRNTGFPNTIEGIIQTGVDITGITNDGILAFMQLDTADRQYVLNIESHIVVAPSKAVALLWEEGYGVLTGTVTIYKEAL